MTATSPAVWERRLEREGLGSIDASGMVRRQEIASRESTAVERWIAWARDVLATHKFTGDVQRRIWSLYSDGQTIGKIATAVGLARSAVMFHVRRVRNEAPPAPVRNPWLKNGRHYSPPPNDNQLLALLREYLRREPMAKGEKLHYSRVILKNDVEVRNIAKSASRKNVMIDIDGYRHAGGIDFEFDTKINQGGADYKPGKITITVPWDNIRQADVETEVTETP